MSRSAIVFVWLFAVARPTAGQAPYRVTWWDAASVGTAGALTLIHVALNLPHGLPPCAPCDPASVPNIERAALHNASASAATTSTPTAGAVRGAAALVLVHGLAPHHRRRRGAVLLYAGAVGVAVLRVTGGKHFPTDVAGGAVLGSSIGWLTATVHARAP